jgi:hypothetical protein
MKRNEKGTPSGIHIGSTNKGNGQCHTWPRLSQLSDLFLTRIVQFHDDKEAANVLVDDEEEYKLCTTDMEAITAVDLNETP